MLGSSRASACHGFEGLHFPPGIFSFVSWQDPHSALRAVRHQCLPIPSDSYRLGKGVKNLGVCLNCMRKGLNIA